MTKEEYKKLKDANTQDSDKLKIVEEIINRAKERPENKELKKKIDPYLEFLK
ncbi:MAG: hypothetical protein KJ593_02790 [Candidatus Omnitrophica bacterium]|nr:hypothetical protein [Candidatus Omnitrophota bacterium]